MQIRAFITHKLDERFVDCQDRFSVNPGTKSIALSDGMSESIFQKIWADLLVNKYVSDADWVPNKDNLKILCNEWRKKVDSMIPTLSPSAQRRTRNSLILQKSAGATFVGLRFRNQSDWGGYAIGDSCAIEIGEDGKSIRFYTTQSGCFDNTPDYLDSNPRKEGKGKVLQIKGTLCDGKKLLIVSDPFSDYLFKHKEDESIGEILSEILSVNSHEDFEKLVKKLRDNGMHNDDSTLIIVENECDSFIIKHADSIQKLINEEKITQKPKLLTYKGKREQNIPIKVACVHTSGNNTKKILNDEEANIAGIISNSFKEHWNYSCFSKKKEIKMIDRGSEIASKRIIDYLLDKIQNGSSFHI